MYYVDSDNAMGSGSGDVDDGFAIAALLLAKIPLIALGSVTGNTSACLAHENNKTLAQIWGGSFPILKSEETASYLTALEIPLRILALGPLTNVSKLMNLRSEKIDEVIIVGGNSSTKGKFPPFYPYEFNLVKDRQATLKVVCSQIPVTVIPLDVAKKFQVSLRQVEKLPGKMGLYLYQNSKRWFFRSRLLKWKSTVPLWDLVASLYVIEPGLFKTEKMGATIHSNTWIDFRSGDRELNVVQEFDPVELWGRFERLFPGIG